MRVLLSAPYMIDDLPQLRPLFDRADIELRVAEVKERLDENQLIDYLPGVDGVVCGDDAFTAKVLDSARPRLKVIAKWGTGIDSIDLEAAKSVDIQVFNTPNAFTAPVADTVMGFILSFARSIHASDRSMKTGEWKKLPSRALQECLLGVVGVGNIGRAVLERAQSFGMQTIGNDIDDAVVRAAWTEMVSLTDLLGRSDFVSINCDLNSTSRHLIDGEAIAAMKQGAVLVNTARGAVVDEIALIDALREKRIAGAALDVFEDEPLPIDSPLRSMPNVLLSAHNANSGNIARWAVHRNTIASLFMGLGLEPPEFDINEVDEN